MHIRIKSEEELIEKFTRAVHILRMLRKYTNEWRQEHGIQLRRRIEYWEGERDKLLEELSVPADQINLNTVVFTIE